MAEFMQFDDDNDDGAHVLFRLEDYRERTQRYLREQVHLRLEIERRRLSIVHQCTLQMRNQNQALTYKQTVERVKTQRTQVDCQRARVLAIEELVNLQPQVAQPNPNARQRRRAALAAAEPAAAELPPAPPVDQARRRRRRNEQQF